MKCATFKVISSKLMTRGSHRKHVKNKLREKVENNVFPFVRFALVSVRFTDSYRIPPQNYVYKRYTVLQSAELKKMHGYFPCNIVLCKYLLGYYSMCSGKYKPSQRSNTNVIWHNFSEHKSLSLTRTAYMAWEEDASKVKPTVSFFSQTGTVLWGTILLCV